MSVRTPEYILALDYGEKRIGVAIAHTVARFPRPLTTLTNNTGLFEAIASIIEKEHIGLIVVGLPRGMDGGYTEQTRLAEAFSSQLAKMVDVPVALADETLTSVDAETALAGKAYDKKDIDALAATYILERYLQEQASKETHT